MCLDTLQGRAFDMPAFNRSILHAFDLAWMHAHAYIATYRNAYCEHKSTRE